MKYVIPFVDHYSTCTRVYFSADKRPATITKIALSYIKDMKDLYGVEVKHISTDRGQEYHQYQDAVTPGVSPLKHCRFCYKPTILHRI